MESNDVEEKSKTDQDTHKINKIDDQINCTTSSKDTSTKPSIEYPNELERGSNTSNESYAISSVSTLDPVSLNTDSFSNNYAPIGDCDDNILFRHPQLQSAIQELCRLLASNAFNVEVDPESHIQLAYFLLAYHMDVQAAAKAYQETLKWQEENGVLSIRKAVRGGLPNTEFPNYEIIQNTFPHDLSSTDITCKNGMPVAITRLGITDLTKLSTVVTLQEFMVYMIHVFEKRLMIMEEHTKKTGYLCRYVDIHDLHCPRGLFNTFSTNNVGYFKWWLMTLAPHYPEQVRKVFVVNVPMLFSVGWKVTKVWLPNRTQSKIEIIGGNFKTTLEKLMDTQLLPIFLGGKGGWPSNAEQVKSPLSPITSPLKP